MSRSGYTDDCENLEMWRGAVRQAIRGKRGQAFLREMLLALDEMSNHRLIQDDLITAEGDVQLRGGSGRVEQAAAGDRHGQLGCLDSGDG